MSNAHVLAIKSFAETLASAKNKQDVARVATRCADSKVAALLKAQSIDVKDFTDFYEIKRVVNTLYNLSRNEIAKSEDVFIAAMKTAINALDAQETVTRADIEDAILHTNREARAHVYQRKVKIETDRQVQLNVSALKTMRLIDRNTLKALDSDLMQTLKVALKEVAV